MVPRLRIRMMVRQLIALIGLAYLLAAGGSEWLHYHSHACGQTPDNCPICIDCAIASTAIPADTAPLIVTPHIVSHCYPFASIQAEP